MSQFLKQAQEFLAKNPNIGAKELSQFLAQCPPARGGSGYRRLHQCYAAGLTLKEVKKDLDGKAILNKTFDRIQVIKMAIAKFTIKDQFKAEYGKEAALRKLNGFIRKINPEFEAKSAISLGEVLKNYKIKF